ncbi:hypothetical protein EV360DRAFT_85946 [Lentinula raphanica]|nr:hypothetical protein EV360DRAFT_85946 [Lentinula raphanica]
MNHLLRVRDDVSQQANYIPDLNRHNFQWLSKLNIDILVNSIDPTEPVVLSMVLNIDCRHSNLTLDGGYIKPTPLTPALTDVKLLFAGCSPVNEPFKSDFGRALHFLDTLLDAHRNPGIGWKACGFTFNDFGSKRFITLTHSLFNPINAQTLTSSTSRIYHDRYNVWSTAGWPFSSARARQERLSILNHTTHTVNPLPLHNILIASPEDYTSVLSNKPIVVDFTLQHSVDIIDKIDTFEGVIVGLHPIEALDTTADDLIRRYFS